MAAAFDERLPRRLVPVAELLAKGHSNQRIASELSLALHTVENYVAELKELLGAEDRVGLVLRLRDETTD